VGKEFHFMFEAYAVGIRLSLVNNVSSGVLNIAHHFRSLSADIANTHGRLSEVEVAWRRLQRGALVGGGLAAVGVGLGAMIKGPYEEAKKLEMAKAKWRTLNLSDADNAEAFATATTVAHKVMGTAIADNIGLVQDLHTAFGDLHHAIDYAPALAKFVKVAQIQSGDEHAGDGLVYNAVKAIEHRGGKVLSDPGAFNSELDRMSKVYVGSGGKVSPADYFAASQTGKMAYTLASPDFLYGPFAAYMQAKTGSTASTALATTFSSLAGGHMDKQAKGFFASMGLADGTGKGLRADLASQFTSRPDLFIWNVLEPAIKKRFGMDMTDEQIAELIARNTNRNTGDFLGWFVMNKAKAVKDAAIFDKSMGYAAAYANYSKTPEGAEQAYHAAMRNLKALVGTAYLPMIVDGLTKLAPALTRMADWASRNQGTVKVIAGVAGALSVLAAASGLIVLVNTAFGGLAIALGGTTVGGFTISALLGGVAKGLGVVGAALFAAYEVVQLYKAGKSLYDAKTHDGVQFAPGVAARLRDPSVVHGMHGMDGDFNSPFIGPPAPRGGAKGGGDVYLDGRKVGRLIAPHLGDEASRPIASTSRFDGGPALAPFALTNLN
jgi:hypothetical protein